MPRADRPGVTIPQRVAGLVVPLILVAVALFQVRQATVNDQSSWSGAGFGMFATIDNEDSRFLRGYVLEAAGERLVGLPRSLAEEALAVRVLPTADRLHALARRWRVAIPGASQAALRALAGGPRRRRPQAGG
ncbi:MAG: hypothetical protein ACLGI2_07535 [Acidimicrobiia bacterium]